MARCLFLLKIPYIFPCGLVVRKCQNLAGDVPRQVGEDERRSLYEIDNLRM